MGEKIIRALPRFSNFKVLHPSGLMVNITTRSKCLTESFMMCQSYGKATSNQPHVTKQQNSLVVNNVLLQKSCAFKFWAKALSILSSVGSVWVSSRGSEFSLILLTLVNGFVTLIVNMLTLMVWKSIQTDSLPHCMLGWTPVHSPAFVSVLIHIVTMCFFSAQPITSCTIQKEIRMLLTPHLQQLIC